MRDYGKTYNEIVVDIECFIKKCGGNYSAYYCGITNDVERRLFVEHNVDKERDCWIHRTASSDNASRKVEQYFLDKS